MKLFLGVLVGLVGSAVLWLLLESRPGPLGDEPLAALGGADAARVADLEHRVDSLESAMQRLSVESALQAGSARAPVLPPAPSAEAPPPTDGFNPRWYLEQYVRSFEAGGEGSEYFRLAVDAWAPDLLSPIGDLVRNPAALAALRGKLAAMLGTPRFSHNTTAIDALLALLNTAGGERLEVVALDALVVIGDASTAIVLERLVFGLAGVKVQQRALAVMVQLYGPDANRGLQRLFAAAPGTEQRALVIAALSAADPDAALDVFRQASTAEDAVRLQAAQSIHRFRGDAFVALIDQWLGYERDEQVRRALGESKTRMSQVQPYSAQKAAGAPDAIPDRDDPNAWASRTPEMGRQWLELRYRPARRANGLRIHEVNVAGAVVQVLVFDEVGRSHEVWSGRDPTVQPGVFQLSFPATAFRVERVRIVLDTDLSPGWSEIDAVQLLGPDGGAFAAEATASSSYGQ